MAELDLDQDNERNFALKKHIQDALESDRSEVKKVITASFRTSIMQLQKEDKERELELRVILLLT